MIHFAFSSENWGRPEKEIGDLLNLLKYQLENELNKLIENGVKLKIIGDATIGDTRDKEAEIACVPDR